MKVKCFILAMWLLFPLSGWAQTYEDEAHISPYEIETRLLLFQEEVSQLYLRSNAKLNIDYNNPLMEGQLQSISNDIGILEKTIQSFGTRWDTYQQAVQTYIAADDSLLNKVSEVQQLQQTASESIAALRQSFDKIAEFSHAEVFLFSQDSAYSSLYNQAMELSLLPQLAAQLDKLKASEQLLFADVQAQYNLAKQAAIDIPNLSERMNRVESKFIELKVVSEKIQQAVYKPIIERIKDWLIGFAAVAILMMFFNMLMARLNTLKKMREQAKKLKDMAGGRQDYPTI
ncbi:MAG: hypothetical protein K5856_08570 [Bacteroidaceae bacterium]|nr:hypothetical protein [Bacteroidaceae bacterium]